MGTMVLVNPQVDTNGKRGDMDDVRIWAEAGEWTRGEPALVVMRGQYDCGQLIDAPEVLHDVPLDHADEWDDALAALGYRKVPESREVATEYGVAFDIEAF